ncbi:hypothetical protein QR680_011429 [Steinernema hermaphroditum]|uniref:Kinesin heavy chain n=1 Tax=Steinernema hermaphroditum TaxID=289476 RepID=A0AA39LYN7_9BILA|nr:hypothetical protein QR680_011429 [Steinernema hermaphroditum]
MATPAGAANPSECGIQVFCRIRPLNETEKANNYQFIPKFPNQDTISISGKSYSFDKVFDPSCKQEHVYMGAAYHIVQDVLSGYNGTVFAYGQTSSGKTHTMEGVIGDPDKQGIIPRIISDIFNHIYNMDNVNLEFHIKVSYFEIYNEKIRDLLDVTKTNLSIHEDKNRVPYVKGATEQFVSNPEEVLAAIEEGKNNRQVAVTNMNEHSSRSHSVFLIQVDQEDKQDQRKKTGKLYLVDLAGSEKVSKTGAEGSVLEEAKNINKSLSALGNVISALAEGTKSHVPYRDSKLTRILQESLGGNSRTTVVICASPASFNEAETKSTLMFGQRAKTIKNVVVVNEELTAEEWKRRYEREKEKVLKMKQMIIGLEAEVKRWRAGEKVSEAEWAQSLNAGQMTESALLTPSSSDALMMSIAGAEVPMLTSRQGPITDEEKRKYEEERTKLYQQLDEKDDEIQQQSQMTERLKQQLNEQDDHIKQMKEDYEQALLDLQRYQTENETAREESKEVYTALEELALNLDQQKSEVQQKSIEINELGEQLASKTVEMDKLAVELDELRDQSSTQGKRVHDNVQNILRELADLGGTYVIPEKFNSDFGADKKLDEEMFTHARICISKLSSDYKSVLSKVSNLETGSGDFAKKLETAEKELSETKLQLQQMDVKNKSLHDEIGELEKAKRELEGEVDQLNERVAAGGEGADSGEGKEQHLKQLAQLRDQIAEKNQQIKELTENLRELQVVKDQLQSDFEKLKTDESEKEKRIKSLAALSDKREQAKQDLKGLEETVGKEVHTLQNLRKMFVQDLAQRLKRAPTGPEPDDDFTSSPAQRQKLIFLENNLDQLTKVHKQLVRDNADLRCELPKMEKRLRASMERVKNLESALRDTKENAMKDRKKYQHEVERIKEAVRQRNLARRGLATPQIAKPIRPGQHYPVSTQGIMATEIKIIRRMGRCPCNRNSTSCFGAEEVEVGGFKWCISNAIGDYDERIKKFDLPVNIKCVPTCGKRALWRCEAKVGTVVIGETTYFTETKSATVHIGQWAVTFSFDRAETTQITDGNHINEEFEDFDQFRMEITLQITKISIIDLSTPKNGFIREPSDALRITVDGNDLYLSKWFLTHHSEFFRAMFEGDFVEKHTGSYVLREIEFTEFLRFLAILHGKRRYVDKSCVKQQLTMADMYQCEYVFRKCLQYSGRLKANYYRTLFPMGQEEEVVHVYTIPMDRPYFKHAVEVGGFKWLFRSPGIGEEGVKVSVWCKKSDMKSTMLWNCAVKGKFEVKSSKNNSDGQDKRHKIFSRTWNMYSYGSFSLKYGEVHSVEFAEYSGSTVHFSLEIIEGFLIDLSSPTNELISDSSDAVCLVVEGELLYLSKYILSIHCPYFREMFKTDQDFHKVDVGLDEFLLFIAVLHDKNVPIYSYVAKKLNKLTTKFGCSFDYWFAQRRLKGCW